MAPITFDHVDLTELCEFQLRVQSALATAKAREREIFLQKFNTLIETSGLEFEDVIDILGLNGNRRGTGKVPPKYRNPNNRLETWTGRGRQPRWLTELLGKGAKLGDFKI